MPAETIDNVTTQTQSQVQDTAAGAASPGTSSTGYSFGGKNYASVDELGKAYESAQSELGRWTQRHGDLERQYKDASEKAALSDQWNQWWQRVGPLWGEDVEAMLRQKLSGGSQNRSATAAQMQAAAQQSNMQAQADQFQGFDVLSPQDQYSRMSQMLEQRLTEQLQGQYNDRLSQLAQAVQQTLAQKEQWYQSYLTNHLSLMRKALEHKLQDPSFDVDAVMENAAKAIGGQIDPIELGQQLIAASQAQSRLETAKKEAYEQAKRDIEQTQKNKQMETVPPVGSAPVFKFSPGTGGPRKGLASMRQNAAENLFKKYGADLFRE